MHSESTWLAERRKGIGGSDAGALMNEGYGCSRALFYDKSGVTPDFSHSETALGFFERGHALEDLTARVYAEKTGRKVRRHGARVHPTIPYMRVNIDRQILNDERGPGLLECKTANQWAFERMVEEGVPNGYVLQVQWGLAVTGYEWGAFAVLETNTWKFLQFEVRRNPELIAILEKRASEWWADHMDSNTAPNGLEFGDDRCTTCRWRRTCLGPRLEHAMQVAREREQAAEKTDDSLAPLVIAIKGAVAEVEQAEAKRDGLRETLRSFLGDDTKVLVPSAGIRIHYKSQCASRWDTKALETEHPELVPQFKLAGTPTRPLILRDAKEKKGARA